MGERKGRRSERGLRGKAQGGEGVRVEKGRKDEGCINSTVDPCDVKLFWSKYLEAIGVGFRKSAYNYVCVCVLLFFFWLVFFSILLFLILVFYFV